MTNLNQSPKNPRFPEPTLAPFVPYNSGAARWSELERQRQITGKLYPWIDPQSGQDVNDTDINGTVY